MSVRPKSSEYAAVDGEETACLSETESYEDLLGGRRKRGKPQPAWIPRVRCNVAGTMLVAACAMLTIVSTIQCTILYERRGSNAPRWRPAFSPIYDMMDIRQFSAYTDNSPDPNDTDPAHVYRRPPSPEVDAAWDRIAAADGIYPISAADVARAGKDPALAVDAPASWGFPPGKTKMMGIEAFHQLHCLNALRKGLIINYDYYWGWKYGLAPPTIFARHLNHCVDMLRQHLMCHPDLEPFTFNWRKGQFKPYADFEIQKTCVDFDSLVNWAETNKDPRHGELWKALERPADALEKDAPPGIPHITSETIWSEDGVAISNLTGLEGKTYCLGVKS